MKLVYLGTLSVFLMACQPPQINQAAQQQHFVCKSLIEGFLKTQQLGQYQLRSIRPTLVETTDQRHYVYNTTSDNNALLNTPIQPRLHFNCEQQDNHFVLNLLDGYQQEPVQVMRLDLPSEQMIKQLTAFQLKTQWTHARASASTLVDNKQHEYLDI